MDPETRPELEQLFKSIQTFESLQMAADNREKMYRYNDALMQSLYSILDDQEADAQTKLQFLDDTLSQYAAAMKELFPKIITKPVEKSEPADHLDMIEEVEKFNPYHDSRGRFSNADSAAHFTIRTRDPNKQHMADMAIAREKERHRESESKKPAANPLKNPRAIAGVKRGEPMTWKKADGNNANPNYDKDPGYRTNCQSCVVTFEARMRGYDVQTKPNTNGSKLGELARDTRLAWLDPKTGEKPTWISNENATTVKRVKTWMEETIQPGERYTLQNRWKGRGRTGHIITADKDSDGSLRLYDPQNGKIMKGKDIDEYLGRSKLYTSVYGTKVIHTKLLRVDNKQFNPDYVNDIMEANAA